MRTPLRAWMFGVMVAVLALVSGTAAQPPGKDMGEALGILPSGFGEAVDRDIMTIRDATTKLKTTEAAERPATNASPAASNINWRVRWVITFRTTPF